MVLECRDILQLDPPTNAVIGPSPGQRRVATSKNPTTCTQPSDVLSHKLIHHHIGNKKDHCSQTRCQPIVWPCPIARLWISRTWHMVGDCTPPCHVPSLRFNMCATAPEIRPLPAISRTIFPQRQPIVQPHLMGAWRLPGPSSGGRWPLCFPGRAPHTLPQPFCDVSGAPPPAMSIVRRRRRNPGIGQEWHRGPRGDPPPFASLPAI